MSKCEYPIIGSSKDMQGGSLNNDPALLVDLR